MGGGTVSYKDLYTFLFPISSSNYWFLSAYLGLMIVSPLVNLGLKQISLQQLRPFMAIFSIFTFYSCFLGCNLFNDGGYSFGQALYMYCVAHWLREEGNLENRISTRSMLLLALLIMSISSILHGSIPSLPFMLKYNSVFNITSSVLLFLCFTRLKLKSLVVNRIATAALGCYLLQEGWEGYRHIYNWQHEISVSDIPLIYKIMIFILCFFALWVVSYSLSMLANGISNFILKRIPEKWKSVIPTFSNAIH